VVCVTVLAVTVPEISLTEVSEDKKKLNK